MSEKTGNTVTSEEPNGKEKASVGDSPIGGSTRPSPGAKQIHHLHKLEKKHSSGDLHSRLKTRKLLGVGETDDGDVHRSKLSQILGHSEQLYIKLPRGLRIWQFLTGLLFTVIAIWALFFPAHMFEISEDSSSGSHVTVPARFYGAALLSLAVIFYSTMRSVDKEVIRWSLLASSMYFILQTVVTFTFIIETGVYSSSILKFLALVILVISLNIYFYWAVSHKITKMRKSASNKDLSNLEQKSKDV